MAHKRRSSPAETNRVPICLARWASLASARCNLACRHCYTDCGAHRNAELTTDEWIRFLDQLIADGFISVFFEGGEPFTRDDFEAIVAHATAKMFVAVPTNGTLIEAQRAARLARLRVGRVYIDMLGASAATNDRGSECRCDYVLVVSAPMLVQRQRVLRRHGMTGKRFAAILSNQMPDYEKRRRADFVVPTGLSRGLSLRRLRAELGDRRPPKPR